MHHISPLLSFAENDLQVAALILMAVVYALKIRWILYFPAGRDRQAPSGAFSTGATKGARRSLLAIAEPWAMPSTRQHPFLYVQFVVFHIGVAASIVLSFLIPYAPAWVAGPGASRALQVIFLAAAAVGLARLVRRVANRYLRAMSSPDDYFSPALLVVWLVASVLAASNHPEGGELPLLAYFFLTAFFIIYVPFSKISHYLYYPFSRWYLGKTLGHRGVYPVVRGA